MRDVASKVLSTLHRGPGFTTEWLATETEFTRKQVSDACAVLVRRGLVRSRVEGKFSVTDLGRELLSSGSRIVSGPAGPRGHRPTRSSLRERIWRALLMLRKATIPELLSYAAAGGEKAANNNTRKYLIALERAGYLVRDSRRVPGTSPTSNGFARWILLERTGPKPPMYNPRKKRVYDPNTKKETLL